jgi:flagellar export protein FliJ
MNPRLKQMERLQHLRGLQERRREVDLAKANNRLRQVENQIVAERETANSHSLMLQQAMIDGERPEMTLSQRLRDMSFVTIEQLRKRKVAAANLVEVAQEELVESRRETEQASLLADAVRQEIRKETERREQSVSDDRFAARQDWDRRQESLKAN